MPQSRTFNAAILGSGRFLVTLTGLVSVAVLSRIFTKTDYAAYRQTLLAYKFVEPLLKLGLPLALFYFLPRNRDRGRSALTGNLVLLFSMGWFFAVEMWDRYRADYGHVWRRDDPTDPYSSGHYDCNQ